MMYQYDVPVLYSEYDCALTAMAEKANCHGQLIYGLDYLALWSVPWGRRLRPRALNQFDFTKALRLEYPRPNAVQR